MNARNHQARTAEITDTTLFTEDNIRAAQITAAHFAEDGKELTTFLLMLGIHPSQAGEQGYETGTHRAADLI